MTPPKHVSRDLPWLMPEVIDWMLGVIDAESVVLETGAGGSTVFFAQRAALVMTFENDQRWAAGVRDELMLRNLWEKVDLRFVPDYHVAGLGTQIPPLDLAFVDGRGRVRSVIDVLPRIKPGGWLVLDDSDRARYIEAWRVADAACQTKIVFRSGPDETTAWRIR